MEYKAITHLENNYKKILEELGDKIDDEIKCNTPHRAAQAFQDMTNGYNMSLEDITSNALFESNTKEMIVIKDIEVHSLCEHHILPFFGVCNVAYIPNGKVIGMSKFHEIVNMFSKRFQIQERLTNQIANSISKVLQTDDIAVNIKCKHSCMFMRGIEKDNQFIHTSVMSGKFREVDSIRQELFYMLK